MSKTPAWYGQMWLIIIDFHLAFLLTIKTTGWPKKKRSSNYNVHTVCNGWSWCQSHLGNSIQKDQSFDYAFLSCQEEEEPPKSFNDPGHGKRAPAWEGGVQLLLLTGRIHRAKILPLLGYSFLISKMGVLIHCITLSLATTSGPCGLILFGLATTGAVLAQGLRELLTHLLPWGSPVSSDVWDATRRTGCPCV